MKCRNFGLTILAATLIFAAGCGTAPDIQANGAQATAATVSATPETQTDGAQTTAATTARNDETQLTITTAAQTTTAPVLPNCTVTDVCITERIKAPNAPENNDGVLFEYRLPMIAHKNNPEIEQWCQSYIDYYNGNLDLYRSGEGGHDLSNPDVLLRVMDKIEYETRDIGGLITVQQQYRRSGQSWMAPGLAITFDYTGKVYDTEALLARYGITKEEAFAAVAYDWPEPTPPANFVGGCVWAEDTLYLTAVNSSYYLSGPGAQYALVKPYLLTKQGGVVTAVPATQYKEAYP